MEKKQMILSHMLNSRWGATSPGPSMPSWCWCRGGQGENGVPNGSHDSGNDYKLVNLEDWIEQNPSVIGDKILQKWGRILPFLSKSKEEYPDRIVHIDGVE
ncbi:mannose-6-phosphate isomerase 1-like [Forsythia ovata]|uniref:Mannose-6-phosphate isomerase 1-like n=1 Tax=Forsythia ovata TaxID=205694 RepID=A0ABD1TQN3_9LAMI